MNIIEKMFVSVQDWIEFYLDNSTLSESTKNKIRSFINSITGDLNHDKQITELKPFALNANKWRTENGLTTPEWEQYVKWAQSWKFVALAAGYFAGIAFGIFAALVVIVS